MADADGLACVLEVARDRVINTHGRPVAAPTPWPLAPNAT